MKIITLITIFLIILSSCAKKKQTKKTIKKKINCEQELKNYDEKFLNNDTTYIVSKIKISKYKHLKKGLSKKDNTNLDFVSKLRRDVYSEEKMFQENIIKSRLLRPYSKGKVSTEIFKNIIDTLNIKLIDIYFFEEEICPELRTNNKLYNKILNINKHKNKTGFFIRAKQRTEIYKNEIIDSLKSRSFYKNTSYRYKADNLLEAISKIESPEKTIEILSYSMEQFKNYEFIFNNTSVFENLIKSGNKNIKEQTYNLILAFLKESKDTSDFVTFENFLKDYNSDKFKELVNYKFKKLDVLNNLNNKEVKTFLFYYMNYYTKFNKMNSLNTIKELLKKIKFKKIGDRTWVTDKTEDLLSSGCSALEILSKEKLKKSEKLNIKNIIIDLKLNKINRLRWTLIDIFKNLYPNYTFSEIQKILKMENNLDEMEKYWKRKELNQKTIKEYLNYFKSIGLPYYLSENR